MGGFWIVNIPIKMTVAQQKALISFVTAIQKENPVIVTPVKKKSAKQLLLEEYKEMREIVDLNERKRLSKKNLPKSFI